MNIKTLSTPNLTSLDTAGTNGPAKTVKSEHSDKDRDGNGRREHGENQQQKKSRLTDEEFECAVENLRSLDSLKDTGLIVEPVKSGDTKVVLIKDHTGHVVRRIPESELFDLSQVNSEKPTGHLFNKAM